MKIAGIQDGLNLFSLNTDKFKTFSVGVYLHRELNEEEVTLNALLPLVLKRGSVKFPDMLSISRETENLYGAVADFGIRKKGNNQILCFHFEFVSPQYILKDPDYMERIQTFISDILLNPYMENGGFKKEYVDREKENLKDYIEGIINDKKEYASMRCVEEMCKGEPFALFEYGRIEDLSKIDCKNLYSHYMKILSESKIDAFVVGDVKADFMRRILTKVPRENVLSEYPKTRIQSFSGDTREIKEKIDINQGKICMGFVTNVGYNDNMGYALTVCNSIFGNGAHSKLFNNVREKLSLCYYVYSRLDKHKGIMTVNSGVELENFQKAHDEILLQLENVAKGDITENEINAAKSSIINVLRSFYDDPGALEDYYLNNALNNRMITIDEYITKIEKVTVDEIVSVAKMIRLCTVFYLT